MAVNAYIVITGVDGPSTSKEKAIDVLSFSFGASQTATYGEASSGSEATAGRANVSDLSFMKVLDKTSPLLFEKCCVGKALGTATLYYDKPLGDKQVDYFKIEMQGVIVTSVQFAGSSENPTESVSLAFQKVKVWYNPEKPDHTLAGFVGKGFDVTELKVW